jgi:uncharacterized protein YabN with tetrapyrrole methylase and pyrophosphatase domain
MGAGSLTIVGTGYGGPGRITIESASIISTAEKVLFLADSPLVADWICEANPSSESLLRFYAERPNRHQTYSDMGNYILSLLHLQLQLCVVFYGHPGMFVYPSHEVIIRARDEGFEARMLPAMSAEDCLFADLGIDPGRRGCQSFEATDFLIRGRQADVTVPLILWQVGSLGVVGSGRPAQGALAILAETLAALYGPDHDAVIYEAAPCPSIEPIIEFIPLARLPAAVLTSRTTLYVSPRYDRPMNYELARRLGVPEEYLAKVGKGGSRSDTLRPCSGPNPRSQSLV